MPCQNLQNHIQINGNLIVLNVTWDLIAWANWKSTRVVMQDLRFSIVIFAVKVFEINIVDASFKKGSKLQDHRRKCHSGDKPFRCSVCLKRFHAKHLLNKHTKRHHSCSQTKTLKVKQFNKEIQIPISNNIWLIEKAGPEKMKGLFVYIVELDFITYLDIRNIFSHTRIWNLSPVIFVINRFVSDILWRITSEYTLGRNRTRVSFVSKHFLLLLH